MTCMFDLVGILQWEIKCWLILEIAGVETYGSTEDHSLNSYEGNDIKHHD